MGDPVAVFGFLGGLQREDAYVQWKGKREQSQVAAREILIRYMEKSIHNFTVKMVKHWNKLPREAVKVILWRI